MTRLIDLPETWRGIPPTRVAREIVTRLQVADEALKFYEALHPTDPPVARRDRRQAVYAACLSSLWGAIKEMHKANGTTTQEGPGSRHASLGEGTGRPRPR